MLLAPANPYRISISLANRLWSRIRHGQIGGHHFIRQCRIGSYIADFYCPELGVIVHIERTRPAPTGRDTRADFFELEGYRVVRVADVEMIDDMGAVVRRVADALRVAPLDRVTVRPPRKY